MRRSDRRRFLLREQAVISARSWWSTPFERATLLRDWRAIRKGRQGSVVETAVLFRACLDYQGPSAKRSFLHQRKEHRHKNQDVNGGRDHAADEGSGDWLHDVGADAAFPENGNQARQHNGDGHEFWPEPVHSALDDGLFDVFMF